MYRHYKKAPLADGYRSELLPLSVRIPRIYEEQEGNLTLLLKNRIEVITSAMVP